MKWIKLKDRKPSTKIDGKKILLYRLTNDSQKELSTTIFETNMVKFCDKNETWWMALPEEPRN
tara:strand:- start:343 stop:531 length:189 start_codon:yes stop_codon:yes gene_type:complete